MVLVPPFKTISHNKNIYKKCNESCNSVKVARRGFSFTLTHSLPHPKAYSIDTNQTKGSTVQIHYVGHINYITVSKNTVLNWSKMSK